MQTSPFKTHTLKTISKTYTFLPSPSGEMTFVATADTSGNKTTAIVDAKVARKQYLDLLKEGAASDKKRFTHDCDGDCAYVGTVFAEGRWNDLYVHLNEDYTCTYIARFSDDGPDYSSVSDRIPSDLYPAPLKIAHALYYKHA